MYAASNICYNAVAEPGVGQGAPCPPPGAHAKRNDAPSTPRTAPLIRAGDAGGWLLLQKWEEGVKNKVVKKFTETFYAAPLKYAPVAPEKNFHAPLGRNPGSATVTTVITSCALL
jgi:hypothetical protein